MTKRELIEALEALDCPEDRSVFYKLTSTPIKHHEFGLVCKIQVDKDNHVILLGFLGDTE